jgi:hypothetical protein
MATRTAPTTDALSDVVRWQARAEFFAIEMMLDYRDAEMTRTAYVEPTLRRKIERSAIALTIGESMRLLEGQVFSRLSAADSVREKTPTVWDAFGDGLVDFARVRDIASAVDQLQREESLCRRHHSMKGHGLLHWSTTKPRPPSKPIVVEIYPSPVDLEYVN